MKQTKAERIYRSTKVACKQHIEAWGIEYNPNGKAVGFNNLSTDEVISTRTINAVEKIKNTEKRNNEECYKLGITNEEEYNRKAKVFEMVESTIENARQALA